MNKLQCVFSQEIITVNIITDKIVCWLSCDFFFWVLAVLNINTSGIQLPGYLVFYKKMKKVLDDVEGYLIKEI
jgi:hypothetical protein